MKFNPNDNIYKLNVPREYILLKLERNTDGTLRSGNDETMIALLDEGKTISEAIKLIAHTAMFPSVIKKILCTRYSTLSRRIYTNIILKRKVTNITKKPLDIHIPICYNIVNNRNIRRN